MGGFVCIGEGAQGATDDDGGVFCFELIAQRGEKLDGLAAGVNDFFRGVGVVEAACPGLREAPCGGLQDEAGAVAVGELNVGGVAVA